MNSFLAFGKDYVAWNHEKTGNPVYLHIKDTPKSVPEDRPLKKPTLLAIGMKHLISKLNCNGRNCFMSELSHLRIFLLVISQELMADLTTMRLSMRNLIA